MRLVSAPRGDKREAAKEFLSIAPSVGIDPSLMWVTTDPGGAVREVCLGVAGSGKTVSMFLGPAVAPESDGRLEERAGLVSAAADGLAEVLGPRGCCKPSSTRKISPAGRRSYGPGLCMWGTCRTSGGAPRSACRKRPFPKASGFAR